MNMRTLENKRIFIKKHMILLTTIILFSCSNNKMADRSIDHVTDELKSAIKNYSEAEPYNEGLAAVQQNGKWGYIDKLGKLIIDCKFDKVRDYVCNRAEVYIDEKEGCIDSEGNIIVDIKYESLSFDESDSTFIVRLNDKEGVLDYNGNVIIPLEYQETWNCHEGLRAAKKDSLYGFIDEQGNVAIPFKFGEGGYFSEGMALVEYEGRKVYIDKFGRTVISDNEIYTLAGSKGFCRGLAPVIKERKIIDTPMSFESYMQNIDNIVYDELSNLQMAFINKNGELVCDWINGDFSDFSNNYYRYTNVVTKQNGLVDLNLKWILKPKYNFIGVVQKDGLVYVESETNKAGIFDTHTRKFVLPCEYNISSMSKFKEGLIRVVINDKVGYLNKSNELQIEPKYDKGSDFSEGFAVVYKFGCPGFVDRYGNDTFD